MNPRDQAHGQQGVAPEIKEIVRDPNRAETQDVLPDLCEPQFDGITGRDAGALLGGSTAVRCGQRAAVDLAAGRQRQLAQDRKSGGHHIIG